MRALAIVLALALATPAHAETLFQNLGERPGLVRIVDAATTIWLRDPRVAPSFEDTNIDRFKRFLVDQLCQITGGPCSYQGRGMAAAHKGLHLSTAQFNALAEDLQNAMDAQAIPFFVQNGLIALLAPMHRDVVTR